MSSIKIGERRYRESFGGYLEDFEVGDNYEHRPGRAITEADNTAKRKFYPGECQNPDPRKAL